LGGAQQGISAGVEGPETGPTPISEMGSAAQRTLIRLSHMRFASGLWLVMLWAGKSYVTVRATVVPLNVVFYQAGPNMPLHIFEPRTGKMVRDCLEAKVANSVCWWARRAEWRGTRVHGRNS